METLYFGKIWNDSVATEQRPVTAREYGWASELGAPLIDRYLKMKGIPYSNVPNARSLRKFFSGNIWEFVAGLVLQQLGIIQDKQQDVWTNGILAVKGKLDYLIGGVPDYAKARSIIQSYSFDKEIMTRFMKTIDIFEERIGTKEIKPMVYEIKSCSEYVIDKLQEGGNIISHDLQIYHYLRGLDMNEGHLVYISKNDALMFERIIRYPDVELGRRYEADLITLKEHLDKDQPPPKEELITFENKFVKNFGIEYSNYLTYIYGFKEPSEYSDSVKGKIASYNRVLARLKQVEAGEKTKTGKEIKLTPKNIEAISEMKEGGWDAYELAKKITEIEEDEE